MTDTRESELLQRIDFLERENVLLRQKVDALSRRLFGKSSEQLDPTQLQLLFQELVAPGPAEGKESGPQILPAESARPAKASRSSRLRTARLPEHLPLIITVIEPPEVLAAPVQWRQIGEEMSERLDYEPARFTRLRTVRPKYVHKAALDAVPVVAPLPPSLLERSIVTPGLLAQVLVSKYCDHVPLYRQESIYWSRSQVWISRQSMAQWVGLAAFWLRPIYQEIGREVFGGSYVQVDETPVRYLEPGHGETKSGFLWTHLRPGADVFFSWHTSRAASCLDKTIPVDFRGFVQCDGYTGYDAFARRRAGEIELVGCWAHARRGFVEAKDQAPRSAGLILHMMQNLYRCERRLRRSRASPKLRELARALESRPMIARMHRTLLLWKNKHRFLPQSQMGKAIDYALGQWDSLLLFLDHGQLEIDNNLVENAIRPTAVGKKNWLFFGEAQAGERSAIIYTIVESCRKRGIDPFAYLRDLFTRLPTATISQVKDLTPAGWAKAQRAAELKAAA